MLPTITVTLAVSQIYYFPAHGEEYVSLARLSSLICAGHPVNAFGGEGEQCGIAWISLPLTSRAGSRPHPHLRTRTPAHMQPSSDTDASAPTSPHCDAVWSEKYKSRDIFLHSDKRTVTFFPFLDGSKLTPIDYVFLYQRRSTCSYPVLADKWLHPNMEHYFEVEMRSASPHPVPSPFFGHAIGLGRWHVTKPIPHPYPCEDIDWLLRGDSNWRLNCDGHICHWGVYRKYVQHINTSDLSVLHLGVCYDAYYGTIAFSINGALQGVAFTRVPTGLDLHPMVCACRPDSVVTLTQSYSRFMSLQALCRGVIRQHVMEEDMERLPLPLYLQTYVAFKHHHATFSKRSASTLLSSTNMQWVWSRRHKEHSIELHPNNCTVTFFQSREVSVQESLGVSTAIRGTTQLHQSMEHYFEVAMNTQFSNQAVGLGTQATPLRSCHKELLLGGHSSWALLSTGEICHSGRKRQYLDINSSKHSTKCIGVYYDAYYGTVAFSLGGFLQGVAFSNVTVTEIYPMICASLAECTMTLTQSHSHFVSLKALCRGVVQQHVAVGDMDRLPLPWDLQAYVAFKHHQPSPP